MEEQARPCIFCSVVQKKIPAKVVYEDDFTIAFLDIHPRSTGMTIVIPREHFSEADDNKDSARQTFESALTVADMIKRSLSPQAVDFSIIPSREIQHFHIRVYPVWHGEVPLVENQPKETTNEELDAIAKKIREAGNFVKRVENKKIEEVAEETTEEETRSDEDIEWLRKQVERD